MNELAATLLKFRGKRTQRQAAAELGISIGTPYRQLGNVPAHKPTAMAMRGIAQKLSVKRGKSAKNGH